MDTLDLQNDFSASLQQSGDHIWKRFHEVMPARYFKETEPETQLSHLHVLTACMASGVEQDLVIRSADEHTWTFLTGKSYPGQLGEMLERLPKNRTLTAARAYTSSDGQWVLDIFEMGESQSEELCEEDFNPILDRLSERLDPSILGEFRRHLKSCSREYLQAVPTRIAKVHFDLIQEVKHSGRVVVNWEEINEELDTVRIGIEGTQARVYFQRVARYLGQQGIDIERAYLTSFADVGRSFRYLGFTLKGTPPEKKAGITQDLERLYFVDDCALKLWSELEGFSLEDSETLDFLVTLSHHLLSGKDPVKYARPQLMAAALKHPALSKSYIEKFQNKQVPKEDFEALEQDVERSYFACCCDIMKALEEHNLGQASRQALGAKLDASLFKKEEAPYSVIFAVGRSHQGFHVRFQDVARGGMRLVCPRTVQAHTQETERLFAEAYSLARAQNLKNKDIPEGGAKAAVLVEPGTDPSFCGQCFANTLLDLTVGLPQSQDLIYLGPDENVNNELIVWITERAALRGHPLPSTFMSSKPGAGINHKEFGITSEGVTVFLEESLRQHGIDPSKQEFTVKITGGPDGDVAGNEIRILLERYPETAKIVGVADGSGVAEDPKGLDATELLRLFQSVQAIAQFDPAKLGPEGRVVSVDQADGAKLRNTLHNRLVTDAFVPAGGRPNTINEDNWQEYLTQNGEPSSPLVVEGANLFLTAPARRELAQRGVSIIKDSSANKCGVICSSFEVLASMLLSESEFLENKSTYVGQVIERLRRLAQSEASLLFAESARRPDLSLPELSVKLSRVMLRTAEAVSELIDDPLEGYADGTRRVFLDYLPPVLLDVAQGRFDRVPKDYRRRIVACSLAGKIVYREGISYLEDLPSESLGRLALRYLKSESLIQDLVKEVNDSGIQGAAQIVEVLEQGGARTLARLQTP